MKLMRFCVVSRSSFALFRDKMQLKIAKPRETLRQTTRK